MKFTSLLTLAAAVSAAPTTFLWEDSTNVTTVKNQVTWTEDWETSFKIHKSCSPVETNQLIQAFEETKLLANHAKLHTLRNGNSSEFYRKYFGNAPIGEVVGTTRVLSQQIPRVFCFVVMTPMTSAIRVVGPVTGEV